MQQKMQLRTIINCDLLRNQFERLGQGGKISTGQMGIFGQIPPPKPGSGAGMKQAKDMPGNLWKANATGQLSIDIGFQGLNKLGAIRINRYLAKNISINASQQKRLVIRRPPHHYTINKLQMLFCFGQI